MKEHLDILFKTTDEGALYLDLFMPEAENPPLILWIHGGGWEAGDRKTPIMKWQVERGYALASVEYRLTGQAPFPANIIDCKDALVYLRQNAGRYGYNAARVAVAGDSAGGHLAALMGTSAGQADWEPAGADCTLQAVVDYYGPTCMGRQWPGSDRPNSPEERLLGAPVAAPAGRARAAVASPLTYVAKDTPPFLILHGDADDVVPYTQSVFLRDALEAAGVPVALHRVFGGGHGFDSPAANAAVDAFLDFYLRG